MLQLVKSLPFLYLRPGKVTPFGRTLPFTFIVGSYTPAPLSQELWREWKWKATCEAHVFKIGLNNFSFENISGHIVELTEKFTFNIR